MKAGSRRRMEDLVHHTKYLRIREAKDRAITPYLECVGNIYIHKSVSQEEIDMIHHRFAENVKKYLHSSVPDYYHYISLLTSHEEPERHS